ncbi:hypothetical protein Zm00014a_041709 [Zea mays]|uniref:Uncharacterized protein n=1 Tax=Zea mays TaxID=4577 RepID=A0A3L6ELC5_MAIZE|nr:hypothetical protein Zm00014a_041709 [Zea mays]
MGTEQERCSDGERPWTSRKAWRAYHGSAMGGRAGSRGNRPCHREWRRQHQGEEGDIHGKLGLIHHGEDPGEAPWEGARGGSTKWRGWCWRAGNKDEGGDVWG